MSFRDVQDPTDRLADPKEPSDEEFRDPWDEWTRVSSKLSVAHWVWEAADLILGVNPLEWLTEKISGDWRSFAKQAEAFHNIGLACTDIARNLESGQKSLEITWWGNAADSAFKYMDTLTADIAEKQKPLDQIRKIYAKTAHGVWTFTESLEDALNGLGDWLIVAALSYAGGTATAESGVGAVVGYGLALLATAEAIEKWNDIVENAARVTQLVNASISDLESLSSSGVTGVNVHRLPDGPYQSPVVGPTSGPAAGERA